LVQGHPLLQDLSHCYSELQKKKTSEHLSNDLDFYRLSRFKSCRQILQQTFYPFIAQFVSFLSRSASWRDDNKIKKRNIDDYQVVGDALICNKAKETTDQSLHTDSPLTLKPGNQMHGINMLTYLTECAPAKFLHPTNIVTGKQNSMWWKTLTFWDFNDVKCSYKFLLRHIWNTII